MTNELVEVHGDQLDRMSEVIADRSLDFVTSREREFGERRRRLLQERSDRQNRILEGERPVFLAETKDVREGAGL